MDKLGNQLANVSLYDVKAYVRKAQNAVLNFSDMESKVREATNNEPWGASTSLMQEIAEGTQSYQHFHEIMPFIYRRFTEKSASEWRQIYKALQLLEYLVKNGSERVVDYARSHTGVIDMLRHFHYVDSKNRDQGINIRNRAEQLLDLLSSVEKIRAERKKSKELNAKTGLTATSSSTTYSGRSKYSGFGNTGGAGMQFGGGGYNQRVYGDGGFNGHYTGDDNGYRNEEEDDFAEYEVGTSVEASKPSGSGNDLMDLDAPAGKSAAAEDDDDFDDFQSAPTPGSSAAPANTTASILDLFSQPAPSSSAAPPSFSSPAPTTSSPFTPAASSFAVPSSTLASSAHQTAQAPKSNQNDIFGSLWESSKQMSSKPKTTPSTPTISSHVASPAATTSSTPAPAATDDLLLF